MSHDPPRDPGRQPERTQLAWRRTMLAGLIVLLLGVRLAALQGTVIGTVAVGGTLLGWLALYRASRHRITVLTSATPPVARRSPLIATLATAYISALMMVLIAGRI